MYDVILSAAAEAVYVRAQRPLARKLARCFEQLQQDPRSTNNTRQMAGESSGYWRYRVGDWRVMYSIEEAEQRVIVLKIDHRSDIYR